MKAFWSKYGTTTLGAAAMALNLLYTIVSQKHGDAKMKEAVAECVKETLKNQAKES